ncbi:DNA methyltransferase [uncultured Brevundimonas sp.]|uniref:DNA methyltransferase n=1 Tax=uncultured Brevundimonas sp. TaxID=213418 RepID=UPI0025CE6CB3|nr:DNA methyltransferase [uncultured Brevundimonas sp.]
MNNAIDDLERIDWNFPNARSGNDTVHANTFFPGNFIPQIPSYLIQILSKPGDVVVDPFGGSGTTGIEASRLGRSALISDGSLAPVLIARGKLAIAAGALIPVRDRLADELTWDGLCRSSDVGSNGEGADPELDLWFHPTTLSELRYIWKMIERLPSDAHAAALPLFSDTLFACASPGNAKTRTGLARRHHWGWVADNVKPTALAPHSAAEIFRNKLSETSNIKADLVSSVAVEQADARQLPWGDQSADLIVTSPPYISMIDYVKSARLLYLWLGVPISQDQQSEIGARYKRFRQSSSEQYIREMMDCWAEMARVLKSGGFAAIVIGESRSHNGIALNSLSHLAQYLEPAWGPVQRKPSRRRVSDREGRESMEMIAVFRKP